MQETNSSDYIVLLFYKYIDIADPEALKQEQIELCAKHKLTSRIIVAKEGINGTLEGRSDDVEEYVKDMQADSRFADVHFKRSAGTGSTFPRVSVKVRPEIVSMHLDGEEDIDPNVVTGKYITAEELHKWITEGKKEFYIVDMRNDYEHKVGYFEGSILAPLSNFRDLPEKLKELEHLKSKTVVTVCTGGIRCEKASGLLVRHGYADVYQLFGGIHTYMEQYPNQHFKGKLYVFDGRITMGFNVDSPEHELISSCEVCGDTSANYFDCSYIHCSTGHRHFICCENCIAKNDGKVYCSVECKQKDSGVEEVVVTSDVVNSKSL